MYYRGASGPLFGANRGSLPDLWRQLEREVGGSEAVLTIPHHTGVMFSPLAQGAVPGGTGPNPDWQHPEQGENPYRPVIEIYSGHGQCECLDADHPLAYERCDFSLNTSAPGRHYAWDVWLTGQRLRGHLLVGQPSGAARPATDRLGGSAGAAAHPRGDLRFAPHPPDVWHDRGAYAARLVRGGGDAGGSGYRWTVRSG